MTEMVLILPLFVIVGIGFLATTYMTWQSVKTQIAANHAARIQAQQRVAGGISIPSIQHDNEDQNPDPLVGGTPGDGSGPFTAGSNPGDPHSSSSFDGRSMYGRVKRAVEGQLGTKARVRPEAQVMIHRMWIQRQFDIPDWIRSLMRSMGGTPFTRILVNTARSYGNEDPFMYALPRWGKDATGRKFYERKSQEIKDRIRDLGGDPRNIDRGPLLPEEQAIQNL